MKLEDLSFSDLYLMKKDIREFLEEIGEDGITQEYWLELQDKLYYLDGEIVKRIDELEIPKDNEPQQAND